MYIISKMFTHELSFCCPIQWYDCLTKSLVSFDILIKPLGHPFFLKENNRYLRSVFSFIGTLYFCPRDKSSTYTNLSLGIHFSYLQCNKYFAKKILSWNVNIKVFDEANAGNYSEDTILWKKASRMPRVIHCLLLYV